MSIAIATLKVYPLAPIDNIIDEHELLSLLEELSLPSDTLSFLDVSPLDALFQNDSMPSLLRYPIPSHLHAPILAERLNRLCL